MLEVNGNRFAYVPIDEGIDSAFKAFYAAGLDANGFVFEKALPILIRALPAFFDKFASSNGVHDQFFNNLTPLWIGMLRNGSYELAQHYWSSFVLAAIEWEQKTKSNIHKGSPFYFWSVSAILQGQLDRGFLLMHKALDEDRRTSGQPNPNWPAFKFVTLDSESQQQFFKSYVDVLSTKLESLLDAYRQRQQDSFSQAEFRHGLLAKANELEHSFLFTYSLAKLNSLNEFPELTESSFAGRLETDILFNLVLAVDSVLKHRYPAGVGKFVGFKELLNKALAQVIGLDVQGEELEHAKDQASSDLDVVLNELLDGSFKYQDGKTRSPMGNDLSICFLLRNHSAHNINSSVAIPKRFSEFVQSAMNVLFLSVRSLPVQ